MDAEELTQLTQNTQGVLDLTHIGTKNSGLSEADISDVMCILHPCSTAAFAIVASTAERNPQNVLQNDGFRDSGDALIQSALEEQGTFILRSEAPLQATDLALRFSTSTKAPWHGFLFGRKPEMCDIVLVTDTCKRVSNIHFSIFINEYGALMLNDMSTNGTVVDDVLLKGKVVHESHIRMLNPGSIIQILTPNSNDFVKFIVRIPSRDGHFEQYERNFQAWVQRVAAAEAKEKQNNILNRRLAAAQPVETQSAGSIKSPLAQNQYGMHWSGGDMYNVVGLIGKGGFATVYQLATKSKGQLFAVKELEMRKDMDNGILHWKPDHEVQIMKQVSHKNIVQYVDYQDHASYTYIIMEFVACGDLQQYLNNNGPLHEKMVRKMAYQILNALAYLHRKKITHRDIKPDNILLANLDPEQFTVKLCDFGLSKHVPDNKTFLKTFCGTLLYCAPEVFPYYDSYVAGKGKKRQRERTAKESSKFRSYSHLVDIWSLGAVLWYSVCTKPPFDGVADVTGNGMFDKIMMTPLDATDLMRNGASNEAIALFFEMLNTDPAARPTPSCCLQHKWFGNERHAAEGAASPDATLGVIPQKADADVDMAEVSSSSPDEQEESRESQTSEVSVDSGSFTVPEDMSSRYDWAPAIYHHFGRSLSVCKDAHDDSLQLKHGDKIWLLSQDRRKIDLKWRRRLGQGSYGTVSAYITSVGKMLAMKTYTARKECAESVLTQFEWEISMMMEISHRHITKVYASFVREIQSEDTAPEFSLLLEPVADKGTLEDFLDGLNDPPSEWQRKLLLSFFGCLACALQAVHKVSMRHKDLKPGNILIHRSRPLLTDFGSAILGTPGLNATTDEQFPRGYTERYKPPECISSPPQKRDKKSDVFSLGCVFLDMLSPLTMPPLLQKYGAGITFYSQLQNLQSDLEDFRREAPQQRECIEVLMQMLARERTDRPSIDEVVSGLPQEYFCTDCWKDSHQTRKPEV